MERRQRQHFHARRRDSIASGIPSRMPADGGDERGALGRRSTKPGCTARTRSMKSCTASHAEDRVDAHFRAGLRHVERRHAVFALSADLQHLAARDEHLEARAAGEQLRDHGRGVDDLLEVIEDEQQAAGPYAVLEHLEDRLSRHLGHLERLRDARGHEGRVLYRAERRLHHAGPGSRGSERARPQATGASCPSLPGPVSVIRRVSARRRSPSPRRSAPSAL